MTSPNAPQSKPEDHAAGKPKRRWRIWVLLLVLVALIGWVYSVSSHAKKQEAVVARIQSLGGHVVYNYRGYRMLQPDGPMFLRKLLGDQYFVTLTRATVRQWNMNVNDLAEVAKGLEEVGVRQMVVNTYDFGDSIVEPLKVLKSAKQLSINDSKLTEKGLKELQEALPNTKIKRYKEG